MVEDGVWTVEEESMVEFRAPLRCASGTGAASLPVTSTAYLVVVEDGVADAMSWMR
jgi:hypothetical protein